MRALSASKQRLSWQFIGIPCAAILATPTLAFAHAPIAGIGDFYNGILHPILSPLHLLILVALGVLIGQHAPLRLKPAMAVFAPLVMVFLLATTLGSFPVLPVVAQVILALTIAVPIATGKELRQPLVLTLLAVSAGVLGLDSGVDFGDPGAKYTILAGTWVAMVALVCDLAFYISLLRRPWQKIGVQIIGSWMIAIALLLLAFCLKH